MRRASFTVSFAVLALMLSWALPGQAAVDSVAISGPGSFATTYVPPAAVMQAGGKLTYVNADTAPHDFLAEKPAPVQCPSSPGVCPEGTPSWCLPPDPSEPWQKFPGKNALPFPAGDCPIFYTPLIFLGQTTVVQGTDALVGGETYDYYCSIHANMFGKLVVLP